MKWLFIILLIILGFFAINWRIEDQISESREWATRNGYIIENVQTHQSTFQTPFYYNNKGYVIIEMDAIDRFGGHHKIWIRGGLFGNDYIYE